MAALPAHQPPVARSSPTRSVSEAGFTLIEILVALVIGLVLIGAVLTLQIRLTRQNVRSTDISLRDNEIRAALDAITRDVSSAGFLFGGVNQNCFSVLNFNSGAPTTAPFAAGFFPHFPTYAVPGGAGVQLPFVAASGITLNYPAAGSTNRSDVLVMRITDDGTQFGAPNPIWPVTSNAGIATLGTGTLVFANSLNPPMSAAAGDMGMVLVPVGSPSATQALMCLRVPLAAALPSMGNTTITSTGATMPTAKYAGFGGQLPNLGLAGVGLSTVQLQSSGTYLMDLGQAANSNQFVYAYFVDGTSFPFPTLVRAKINALNDQEVAGSRQAIAAGVVSLQVLFGVGSPTTGVTSYATWATVVANNNTQNIQSVKVLVLARSIYSDNKDPNTTATFPVKSQFGQAAYTDYTFSASELNQHFTAQEVEISTRNVVWPK